MKKRILVTLLAVAMCLSLAACAGGGAQTPVESSPAETTPAENEGVNTVKVGLICIGDENNQGYTYNFIREKDAVTEALAEKGIQVEWNIGENSSCEEANIELAKVEEAIPSGELQVFDTSTFTVDGAALTNAMAIDTDGGYVADSEEAVFDGAFMSPTSSPPPISPSRSTALSGSTRPTKRSF